VALPATPYTQAQLGGDVQNIQTLTLSADVTNSDTDILTTASPVAAGWPDGTEADALNNRFSIQISLTNAEVVSYTSIDATGFHGCTRGADGTTAAAHTSGATIIQGPHAASYDRLTQYASDWGVALGNEKYIPQNRFYPTVPVANRDILSWYFPVTTGLVIVGAHIFLMAAPGANTTLQLRNALGGAGDGIDIDIDSGKYENDPVDLTGTLTISSGNRIYLRTTSSVNGLGGINCTPLYKFWS
jgi:hypothetical protein